MSEKMGQVIGRDLAKKSQDDIDRIIVDNMQLARIALNGNALEHYWAMLLIALESAVVPIHAVQGLLQTLATKGHTISILETVLFIEGCNGTTCYGDNFNNAIAKAKLLEASNAKANG